MLETAFPALWSAVHGWFTPAVLFLVLNLVIGTIAVTSKATAAAGSGEGAGPAAAVGGDNRRLSRVPSMALDRLRSFKLSRHAAPEPEPPVTGVLDLEPDDDMPSLEDEDEVDEIMQEPEPPHMERSRSDAAAAEELPPLPARLRKSASDKSAFAHFVVEEDAAAVEARRPKTAREAPRRRRLVVAEPEEPVAEQEEEADDAGGEVDARADAFINRFHHQLKLQRIDSFMRYKEALRRSQAGAAGAE